jgi:hypothetical protein
LYHCQRALPNTINNKGKTVAFNNKPANFKIEALDRAGSPVSDEEFAVTIKSLNSGEDGKVLFILPR